MIHIREDLFSLQDLSYKEFHSKLMPTVHPDKIIGIRIPKLRAYAKEIYGTPEADAFLLELPHTYYEEDNLHAMLIEKTKDYETCISLLNKFLPYIDNWATCDVTPPKVLKNHLSDLFEQIKVWIASEKTYMVRYGIGLLMRFYLDEEFSLEYPEIVAGIRSEEYYVNMMIAWYFATALAKQYDAILPYIQEPRLDAWTHNKAIQKAVESYRITAEQKVYLKTLKIKKK